MFRLDLSNHRLPWMVVASFAAVAVPPGHLPSTPPMDPHHIAAAWAVETVAAAAAAAAAAAEHTSALDIVG